MSEVSISDVPVSIASAIKRASSATGTDFDYLVRTAQRESNFNHKAQSKHSSATGLFQFIKSTWLKLVKEEGQNLGLSDYAKHIEKTSRGTYQVRNKSIERQILDLRTHPELSATMAGIFTKQNSDILQSQIGTSPSKGEVYAAHFLGPGNAVKLIRLSKSSPNDPALPLFPNAAQANPGIFKAGHRVRSVKEVYDYLTQTVAGPMERNNFKKAGAVDWSAKVHKPSASLYSSGDRSQRVFAQGKISDERVLTSEIGSIGIWSGMIEPPVNKDLQTHNDQKTLTSEQIDQKLASAAQKLKPSVPGNKIPVSISTRGFTFLQGIVSSKGTSEE